MLQKMQKVDKCRGKVVGFFSSGKTCIFRFCLQLLM